MKKIILSLFVTMTSLIFYAQTSFGGGVAIGSSKIGVQARAVIPVSDAISVVPYFTYLFAEKDTNNKEAYGINFDGHYKINLTDNFKIYPLIGLRYYTDHIYWEHYNGPYDGEKVAYSDIQLNIGAGANYILSENMKLYIEGKTTGGSFGILFSF